MRSQPLMTAAIEIAAITLSMYFSLDKASPLPYRESLLAAESSCAQTATVSRITAPAIVSSRFPRSQCRGALPQGRRRLGAAPIDERIPWTQAQVVAA